MSSGLIASNPLLFLSLDEGDWAAFMQLMAGPCIEKKMIFFENLKK
jgi:hypothetical protein